MRLPFLPFAWFVWLWLICLPAGAQAPIDSVIYIQQKIKIPGIQVTYANPHESHTYYLGEKRAGERGAIRADTRFQVASLTKVITTYAFFKLYDRGLIDLDTPLYHYYSYDRLSENPEGQTITARMVLTHRTGLHNWEGDVPTESWRAGKLHNLFKPGTDYKYSGEGFYFLQLVMEKVLGQSFEELIDELVIQPLGMTHSYIIWQKEMEGHTASGHRYTGKAYPLRKMSLPNAAYTFYSTSTDYTQFVQQALNRGEGLQPETHQLMIAKATEIKKGIGKSPDEEHVPLTLGMRQQLNKDEIWLWHTGSNPGFRAFFMTNPETGESLVAFTNSEGGFKAMPLLLKLFLGDQRTYWAYTWRKGELD